MPKHLFLFAFVVLTAGVFAQPADFDKMFHPQTEDEIAVMKKSAQKTETTYMYTDETGAPDSGKIINTVRKYDAEGRLIEEENYMGSDLKYSYDKNGRVVEYYEDNKAESQLLHFTVTYGKKGAIESIENKAPMGKRVSYNKAVRTLLISQQGGYVYRYILNDDNQPEKIEVEYYQSKPYSAEFTYDKKGQLLQVKGIREQGEDMVKFTTTYTYTDKLLTKTEENLTIPFLNNAPKKGETTTYTYTNKLLSKMVSENEGTITIYAYLYDEQGRTTQISYYENEELVAKIFYSYR